MADAPVLNLKVAMAIKLAGENMLTAMQSVLVAIESGETIVETMAALTASYELLYVLGQFGEQLIDQGLAAVSQEEREAVREHMRLEAKPMLDRLRANMVAADGAAG